MLTLPVLLDNVRVTLLLSPQPYPYEFHLICTRCYFRPWHKLTTATCTCSTYTPRTGMRSGTQQLAALPGKVSSSSSLKQLSKVVRQQQLTARSMNSFGDRLLREAEEIK
jgi:hypothetical protein